MKPCSEMKLDTSSEPGMRQLNWPRRVPTPKPAPGFSAFVVLIDPLDAKGSKALELEPDAVLNTI
jgi:hypothetical protein